MPKKKPAAARPAPSAPLPSPQIHDTRRFLQSLLDNLPGAVYRCRSDRDWTTEFVSDGIRVLTGYDPGDFLRGAVTFGSIIVPEDQDRVWQEVQRALAAGRAYELRYAITASDGQRKQVWERGRGVHAANGALLALEGFITDVTPLAIAEDQVRLLERRLAQSQRMEAIGRLAGGVAHDFNNLLTAIQGYSEIMLDDLGPDSPHRGEVDEIRKAAERAAALVQQLLAFGRRQVLQPRIIDVEAVVSGMWPMLERAAGRAVEMVRQSGQGLLRVRADPSQLEIVLMNLVLNARDAMPSGGRLTIATANLAVEQRFEAGDVVEPGTYVSISVADTGVGMDPETRERVFEPFFTTKRPGTGLGLSTVYGIVKQSMGYVTVHSELGKGSRFAVLLPGTSAPVEAAAEVTARGGGDRRQQTVLLVEDEESVRRLASRILKRAGHKVLEAVDGQHALEIAQSHDGPIHLMLSDVVMPRMGGREAAERITALRPDVKVLFMSAYARDELAPYGLAVPGLVLIQKPFEIDDLTGKVAALLGST
jgi:signal transduction histidine kinase